MHKFVILIEPLDDWQAFEDAWPEFLHLAEAMPGLLREASSQVDNFLIGHPYAQVHELFFDSLETAQAALASPAGRAAGRLLQQATGGKLTLFFAEYKEDYLANIRKYREAHGSG
jgi:uncharacterized protein (TIGR02118 family)